MNWEAIGAIGEIVSGIVVVASADCSPTLWVVVSVGAPERSKDLVVLHVRVVF